MKYLYWRGSSLYCRYPIPGWPETYPLKIYTNGSKTDINRCERMGEERLAEIRVKFHNGTLFPKPEKKEPEKYNPKFWRIAGRYWYYHLRFQKSGRNERYHLMHSLKKFGKKFAAEIYRDDIELWRNEMRCAGASVNSVNNRYAYLCAAYRYANLENNPKRVFAFNPVTGMKKLSGANVRTFVLTKDKFERNYEYLKQGNEKTGLPPNPRFAIFYLALWETGRRPNEVSLYEWEWIREVTVEGMPVHVLFIPPKIAKTAEPDTLPISNRLWEELSQLGYRQGIIFRNREGARWKYWDRHKRSLERKFGADCGWIRDCRRGMITHKCEVEGHDPKHVQAISGHRTQSVFNRYRIGNLANLAKVVNPPTDYRQIRVFG